ncbi:MAG: rhodanese-like domain-containing protein [Bacteroidota bacterium]
MQMSMKWRSSIQTLILLLGLTFSLPLLAQKNGIESGSYRVMLRSLLSHTVPETTVSAAQAADHPTLFLDTRERYEFEVSHIQGARWVGYDNFDMDRLAGVPKDTPLIVYCSVGYRSEKISERLLAAGFTNVANLYGGIFEWKNQDQAVVDMQGRPTERVHAYSRTWGIWLKEGEKVYD